MILQIHDELIFEVERARLPAVAATIKHEMEHALELSVPLEATLKSGTPTGMKSREVALRSRRSLK
jgi:DNA polymerase-1